MLDFEQAPLEQCDIEELKYQSVKNIAGYFVDFCLENPDLWMGNQHPSHEDPQGLGLLLFSFKRLVPTFTKNEVTIRNARQVSIGDVHEQLISKMSELSTNLLDNNQSTFQPSYSQQVALKFLLAVENTLNNRKSNFERVQNWEQPALK